MDAVTNSALYNFTLESFIDKQIKPSANDKDVKDTKDNSTETKEIKKDDSPETKEIKKDNTIIIADENQPTLKIYMLSKDITIEYLIALLSEKTVTIKQVIDLLDNESNNLPMPGEYKGKPNTLGHIIYKISTKELTVNDFILSIVKKIGKFKINRKECCDKPDEIDIPYKVYVSKPLGAIGAQGPPNIQKSNHQENRKEFSKGLSLGVFSVSLLVGLIVKIAT